eukprot:scaffold557_cov209-Pinguiococcus_pyrenoidosus.AAC.2
MRLPKLELEFGQLEELEDKADELSALSDRLKEEVEKLLQKPLEFFEAFAARAEERLETLPCDLGSVLEWTLPTPAADTNES